MKKILGLDLGTNSIGWAVVNEAENPDEHSSITRLGVRANPLTVDEQRNFESGKPVTTNANRTLKRSMRRNLQRYKLRRSNLIEVLTGSGWITAETILAEHGNHSTVQTLRLRAKAASEAITLEELSRVLLMLNKKRGYRSSRKTKDNEEDGQAIDSMDVAKYLYDNQLTPGEYALQMLSEGKYSIPDFYRSDLIEEFDRIWATQKAFYPGLLTDSLKESLSGKSEKQVWAICRDKFNIEGTKRTTKGKEQIRENFEWRAKAVNEKLDLESLTVVFQKISSQIKTSSGYLGNISDRSKELYFKHQTVGQYLVSLLDENPNTSLKNRVFYRQDYMDEFERIWSVQAKFHPQQLTDDLKKEIRDIIIFYQRPLKSQKGLVNICELEQRQIEVEANGKKKIKLTGPKVCPKSSPLFQDFKIWQAINNIKVNGKLLAQEDKEKLAAELEVKEKMSKTEILKLLFKNHKELDMNFKEIEGNRTQATLYKAYARIVELSGHGEYDSLIKLPAEGLKRRIYEVFHALGYNTEILKFDSDIQGNTFEQQPLMQLWHLLYSYEGDKSKTGTESLITKISEFCGLEPEYAKIIASVTFAPDYGSLSSKAIKKILPYMKEGNEYSVACSYAGYRHSRKSLTKEELENKTYKDHLELLPKNSLRNPVVEKILNQMVNVVNSIIGTYGKPDEIRIELARELKKSKYERKKTAAAISRSAAENDRIQDILKNKNKFHIQHPSKNDITRYKLYEELRKNGNKTLYSNTYIPEEKLFSKEFDIEHIIPQAKLFDDSFANKTLEARQINIEKSNMTAFDFVKNKYGESGAEDYRNRVEQLYSNSSISKTKYKNLLMSEKDIPSDFIERDLRDSQYIAKKAKEMLEDIVSSVVTTTGSITKRLREDWQLVDIMQELNWNKYNLLGLTESYKDRDGRTINKIIDWTKRNDHRHHAMDALTIAFTRRAFIQYLNNLNARVPKGDDEKYFDLGKYGLNNLPVEERSKIVRHIESTMLYRDSKGKLRFCPPMPLEIFRAEAKRQLENILVSIKAKNKVVTRNINITKRKSGENKKVQFTPRGQLHNETIYGSIRRYCTKEEKIGAAFDAEKIQTVTNKKYREALLKRLNDFGNDPKKAFTGKNSLEKNPVYMDESHTLTVPVKVKILYTETVYTIRKAITPDNFKDAKAIDKVIDKHIREILHNRLSEYDNDSKKAFSNLDENPIWQNHEKGIAIKTVTITGVSNAIPLHDKHDLSGKPVMDEAGKTIPSDFVSTSNNHHVAIYQDTDGNLQEQIVSFYDAVCRINLGLPVIDREYKKDEGWKFLFTMKQNEYFVFPNPETGFNPHDIDLMNPDNYALISPNLYRVQKLATKDYTFRHHLETNVDSKNELKDINLEKNHDDQ